MKITANKVTFARIVLVPIPCALLIYGGTISSWFSFVIFLILGATDFVDGMMARREGPTTLGGLLDPVADKIFVSSIILTFCAAGIFGIWFPALVMFREFLLTALRTSVSLKKHSIVTSKLAKMKTIFQMGGLGTIFLSLSLHSVALVIVMLSLAAALFIAWLIYSHGQPATAWMMPVVTAFLAVALLGLVLSKETLVLIQAVFITGMTWASGISYIVESYKLFSREGFYLYDWTRIFWVAAFALGVCPLVAFSPELVLPIILAVSTEFALGGIDNIVSAQIGRLSNCPLLITASAATITTLCFYLNMNSIIVVPMIFMSIALAAVSMVALSWALMRYRTIFWRAL